MKRITSLAIVSLFVAASFVSCKKDYTCNCTVLGQPISVTIKDTKSKAKTSCTSLQTTYQTEDPTSTCAIK